MNHRGADAKKCRITPNDHSWRFDPRTKQIQNFKFSGLIFKTSGFDILIGEAEKPTNQPDLEETQQNDSIVRMNVELKNYAHAIYAIFNAETGAIDKNSILERVTSFKREFQLPRREFLWKNNIEADFGPKQKLRFLLRLLGIIRK